MAVIKVTNIRLPSPLREREAQRGACTHFIDMNVQIAGSEFTAVGQVFEAGRAAPLFLDTAQELPPQSLGF
jgi:hypothetical protein